MATIGLLVNYKRNTSESAEQHFLTAKDLFIDREKKEGYVSVFIYESQAAMEDATSENPTTKHVAVKNIKVTPSTTTVENGELEEIEYSKVSGVITDNANTNLAAYSVRFGSQVLDLTQATPVII